MIYPKNEMRQINSSFEKKIIASFLFCLVFVSFKSVAEDVVLSSVNTSMVGEAINTVPKQILIDEQKETALMEHFGEMGMQNYFPITTNELSPGDVDTTSSKNIDLPQPIFLIGDDERSQSWLVENHDKLKDMHAIGILINVQSNDEYLQIQKLGAGLLIVPAKALDLIKRYNLTHYPVLITPEGIQQ